MQELPVAVDEAVVRAGAGPVPCVQVWLGAKKYIGTGDLIPTFNAKYMYNIHTSFLAVAQWSRTGFILSRPRV